MFLTRSSPTNCFYTMNGAVFELVNPFNYLGVMFDCKLDFRNHITSTLSKGSVIY